MTSVLWYKEHTLSDISIADLISTILLRVLSVNLTKFKDQVLQVNGMAILVNMSAHFEKMDSHTAHRLIALLDLLSRRYFKWKENHADLEKNETIPENTNPIDIQKQANLYSQFLLMIFEILNSCLYCGLTKNPNFIYTLLYSKESFRKFALDPNFSQYIVNIQIAIDYFEDRLSELNFNFVDYSSNAVLDIISAGAVDWKNVYFKYKVNEQRYEFPISYDTSDFYLPHTWTTVLSALPFWPNVVTFKLFNSQHPFQFSKALKAQLQKMHEITITNKSSQSPILDV